MRAGCVRERDFPRDSRSECPAGHLVEHVTDQAPIGLDQNGLHPNVSH